MQLFTARWPDGTTWIVAAENIAQVADILDETADPGACEVLPYDGPFAVEIEPTSAAPTGASYFTFRPVQAPDTSIEMQDQVLAVAYPGLAALVDERDDEGGIDESLWKAAYEQERKRKLTPSQEWADGVKEWWEEFVDAPAENTAALRRMQGVTIPGEPKIETPEQRKLFEAAQHRMMEGMSEFLMSDKPPSKAKKPKKGKPPPKKKSKR